MPIPASEWQDDGQDRAQTDPAADDAGLKSEIIAFLRDHPDQAFTTSEVAANVSSPLSSGGSAGGIKGTIKDALVQTGEERVIKYFLNQLVAEGHVETRVLMRDATETVFYRAAGT